VDPPVILNDAAPGPPIPQFLDHEEILARPTREKLFSQLESKAPNFAVKGRTHTTLPVLKRGVRVYKAKSEGPPRSHFTL